MLEDHDFDEEQTISLSHSKTLHQDFYIPKFTNIANNKHGTTETVSLFARTLL